MDSAEVVIVGGGVMVASIAFHLATAGVTDVLVLEANELGSGLVGQAARRGAGAVLQPGERPARGRAAWPRTRRFPQEVGVRIGLEQVGYLFLRRTAADLAVFEASVAMQNELGVPSRLIFATEALRLNPYLEVEHVLGEAFSPDDGYAHPGSVVGFSGHGFLQAPAAGEIVRDLYLGVPRSAT